MFSNKSLCVVCVLGVLLVLIAVHIKNEAGVSTVAPANEKHIPIYEVDTKDKKVCLTFDAAWGNEDTATLLDILARNNVRATFFVTGGWVEKYPESLKAIADAGHEIGNHSANHKEMSKLSKEEIKEELMSVKEAADKLTGQNMCVFRPPFGDYNNTLIDTARDLGFDTIQWDVDSLDWKDYGADIIYKNVCEHKSLGPGSIVLMHNGAKYTKDALERIITTLRDNGYEFVTVSEMIYHGDYNVDYNGVQHMLHN